jgi:hypothetical protein
MRSIRMCLAALCCFFALTALASAQSRKPGLYETTSEMTWQQTPFPAGMEMPPQAAAAFGGGKHTTRVCVTQEEIDRYGDVPPQSRGNCQLTNVSKSGNSMKAEMTCTGPMAGKGEMQASWSASGQSRGHVHFLGTMQMGPEPTPIEWTMDYTSIYKGPDCGGVKPVALPAN